MSARSSLGFHTIADRVFLLAEYRTFYIFELLCVSFTFGQAQCPPSRVPQVDVTGYLYHDTVNGATA